MTLLKVSVPIIDDGIPEFNEQFFGLLNTSDPDVLIDPDRATVNINVLPSSRVTVSVENAGEVMSTLSTLVAEATSKEDQTQDNLRIVVEVLRRVNDLLGNGLIIDSQVLILHTMTSHY